ncbi:MAG TPA: NAD(P)-dependent oxidoreductase [Micromonosporaceae bacterium]|jgi:nucleoside-diphosphate-sugar epimerase|nr:NAD(P)-dependent oxidoreductase [Micromonosporaceae bacterium]
MRVLLAGATGAVGAPLTRQLIAAGHHVLGLTRTPGHLPALRAAGATPVLADAMDRDALLRALDGQAADAVVHQLTALKRAPMRYRDMAGTNALRVSGTKNLLAAADLVGASRFVTQSIILGYGLSDHGSRVLTEADPFAVPVPGPLGAVIAALAATEQQVFAAPGIDGISLRYGLFYGRAGIETFVELLRRRRFAVPRGGGGLACWIHVDDAAAATVAALERGRAGQAYNIVDREPVRFGDFADEIATSFGAPRAIRVPGWMLGVMPYAKAFITTSMRVSTAKASQELGWSPAVPTYRDGIRALAAILAPAPPARGPGPEAAL